MKIRSDTAPAHGGHILLVTLVITGVIGMALCAYLNLISSQNNFTVRSQIWNLCMPVVEGGLEEALAHVNNPGTTNFATQGWTWDTSARVFGKQRTVGDSYYVVQIQTNLTNGPIITSTGYVPAPATVGTARNSFLAAAMSAPGVTYISRSVRITTRQDPQLPTAMVVRGNIDFNGNDIRIDSYDNSIGAYGGANIGDKGNVTTDADILGNVSTGNADIWGHLSTGPKAALNMGPNSVVGSVAWHAAGNKGAQLGWLKRNANVLMPDVQPPWTVGTGTWPLSQGGFKYELDGGSYEIPGNCTIDSSDTMLVKGDATLWIRGDFNMAGNVKMTGAAGAYKLTVYVSGNINCSGTWDKSITPSDLYIYGLPTCTQVSVATGSHIECTLYAPEADMSLIGNANFFGASVSNSMSMNGTTGYHYDESLGKYAAYRGYVITSWKEM
jgi:hypothetical protein